MPCRSDKSGGEPVQQEQAEGQAAAYQLHVATQPEPQPVTSHSQEAQEATESAADSSAGTAGFSSGGGRYLSVPPSSLWGPPAGVAPTTPSPPAVETASAGQPAPGVGHTAGAFSTDGVDGTTRTDYSAKDDQTASGSPSSRPAARAGFAPGMHMHSNMDTRAIPAVTATFGNSKSFAAGYGHPYTT